MRHRTEFGVVQAVAHSLTKTAPQGSIHITPSESLGENKKENHMSDIEFVDTAADLVASYYLGIQ